jgi:hypothetical protein
MAGGVVPERLKAPVSKTGAAVARVGLIDRSIESWHQIIVLQPEILLR